MFAYEDHSYRLWGIKMLCEEERKRTYGESDKKAIVEAMQNTIDVAKRALVRAQKVDPTDKLAPAMLSNLVKEVDGAADAATRIACEAEFKQYEREDSDEG